ncbi:replication initiation factor domain-containing protein [Paracidovorax citrulli]
MSRAAAGGQAERRTPKGAGLSPSAVTLGETSKQRAKVDWLTATWKPEPDEHVVATVLDLLHGFGLKVEAEAGRGHFGFSEGARLYVRLDDGARHQVALLDWGGDRMRGRARLDLSGTACSRISDWQGMQDWLGRQWETTITRVDLAVDCLNGEFTVDDARAWMEAGEFTAGEGRPPRHSTPGDWLSPEPFYGRTLEIGRRENGKMLRAYEKGLQLAPGSGDKWTRFEVEIRNKDRDVPLDVLTRCDEYFVGAYECLQRLLPAAGERIATHQKEGELSLETMVHHASVGYGKLLHVMRGHVSADDLLDRISRPGVPRRLEKATLAGFIAASSVASQEKRP